jgi:hypothetical protein
MAFLLRGCLRGLVGETFFNWSLSGYASSSHSYWEESDEVFVRNVNRKFFPPFLKPPVEIQLDGTPKPWGEEELKSEQSISLKAYA